MADEVSSQENRFQMSPNIGVGQWIVIAVLVAALIGLLIFMSSLP